MRARASLESSFPSHLAGFLPHAVSSSRHTPASHNPCLPALLSTEAVVRLLLSSIKNTFPPPRACRTHFHHPTSSHSRGDGGCGVGWGFRGNVISVNWFCIEGGGGPETRSTSDGGLKASTRLFTQGVMPLEALPFCLPSIFVNHHCGQTQAPSENRLKTSIWTCLTHSPSLSTSSYSSTRSTPILSPTRGRCSFSRFCSG